MSANVRTFASLFAAAYPEELLEAAFDPSSFLSILNQQPLNQWQVEQYGVSIPLKSPPEIIFDLDKITVFDDALDQSMREFQA